MMQFLCHTRSLTLKLEAFLGESKVEAIESEITHAIPCRSTMRESLQETSVETLVLVRHESLCAKLYFAYATDNKRGTHNMIKQISFYDIKKCKFIY